MAGLNGASNGASERDPRLLRSVRLAALGSLLLFGWVVYSVHQWLLSEQWAREPQLFCVFVLYLSPLVLCYLLILWLVPSGGTEAGIHLARITGSGALFASLATLCPAAALALVALVKNRSDTPPEVLGSVLSSAAFLTVWCGIHLVLRRQAGRALQQLGAPEKQEEWKWLHVWGSAGVTAYLIVAVIVYAAIDPGIFGPRVHSEANCVGSLRTIRVAADEYNSAFKVGYPASLAILGGMGVPTCTSAGLIDMVLASGKKSGYQFSFIPFRRTDKVPAPGCPPGFEAYVVVARPIEFGKSGNYSFYLDDSGTIRFTKEDRPATLGDPALN